MTDKLESIYKKLYSTFGAQCWWPAETPFEVTVGAILTQNTSWQNVEKAIDNLKKHNLLHPRKLHKLTKEKLGRLIKSAGFFNLKAKRLKEFLNFIFKRYEGDLGKLSLVDTFTLRAELLSVKGIGPETADSMLLYAFNKPVFVIDAYTRRILERHKLLKSGATYSQSQELFMKNLKPEVKLYNEYHALLVKLAKDFCLKGKPKCQICPLR